LDLRRVKIKGSWGYGEIVREIGVPSSLDSRVFDALMWHDYRTLVGTFDTLFLLYFILN
jgi:hypothetical protein